MPRLVIISRDRGWPDALADWAVSNGLVVEFAETSQRARARLALAGLCAAILDLDLLDADDHTAEIVAWLGEVAGPDNLSASIITCSRFPDRVQSIGPITETRTFVLKSLQAITEAVAKAASRLAVQRNTEPPGPELISLAQVPGLEPLAGICRELKIEITAYGSIVRRLFAAIATSGGVTEITDLLALSPLLSDCDLRHSGPASQTPEIRRRILAGINGAECFRWEIFSDEELAPFRQDEPHLPIIPATKLELSTLGGRGITDIWEGKQDVATGKFRLIRNGFIGRSTQVSAGKDCELLYALRYLHLLAEALAPFSDPESQPGWEACRAIISDCAQPGFVMSLQEHRPLRTRLRYRLLGLRSAAASDGRWTELVVESGLDDLLDYLDEHGALGSIDLDSELVAPNRTMLLSSCLIGGDMFRLVPSSTRWQWTSAAMTDWTDTIKTHVPLTRLTQGALSPLADGQAVLAASPSFPMVPGDAGSGHEQEHIHFQVPLETEAAGAFIRAGEDALALIILLSAHGVDQGNSAPRSCTVPISGCCFLRRFGASPLLNSGDVPDPQALITQLRSGADPLSQWLWASLTASDQAALQPQFVEGDERGENALNNILDRLNGLVAGDGWPAQLDPLQSTVQAQEMRNTLYTVENKLRYHRALLGTVYGPEILRAEGPRWLLQVRLDCGDLLAAFPRLVAAARVGRVKEYTFKLYVASTLAPA